MGTAPEAGVYRELRYKAPLGDIDVETCSECGGAVKIITSIEDPAVINKILAHLDQRVASSEVARLPQSRAPPMIGFFQTGS